ncbi:MAG TPA: nucleotidyl transferase AbiEii/AbiGii toxin family protein [Chryseolinea sp.]|nr:nucleotidyl transferase AbiEii/AbiGii toxin family protein [Chryseolinea sp.]
MLHYQTIDSPTLELLKKLLSLDVLQHMRLAGGTSLALQYGHRKSIDIDLFGILTPDSIALTTSLASLGDVKNLQNLQNIKSYLINGIKVDIVNYPYPWISELMDVDNLRLANEKDIAAMKLAAITGRGSKKDFFDLYFLLKHYSVQEILNFYSKKYSDGSVFMVLKSLTYFDDAEEDADPLQLIPVAWHEVKRNIVNQHKEYLDSLV